MSSSSSVACDDSSSTAADRQAALVLEDQLCFSLYTSSLAMVQVYKPMLEQLGLTYPQFLVMTALWQGDGVGIKQLAERIHQDSGSLTPLVKRLEAAGYLMRKRDARDERNLCITLTDAGRALETEGRRVAASFVGTCELARAEAGRLRDALQALETRLRARIDRQGGRPGESAPG